jgi:hypothetical protein
LITYQNNTDKLSLIKRVLGDDSKIYSPLVGEMMNESSIILSNNKKYVLYVSLQWYAVALVKHYRGEGKVHNFNFLDVASHFLNNAKDAYQKFINL